jgi:hypothetical protein
MYSGDLGEKYQRGGKKALDDLHARVSDELQRILRPQAKSSSEGPEVLKRLLQLRPPKSAGALRPPVRVLRVSSRIVDGAWEIEAELSINPTSKEVKIAPRLSFRCEGSPSIPVGWRAIELEENADAVLDGYTIVLKPKTKRVAFHGYSDPQTHPAPALESMAVLDINSKFGADQ